MGDKSPKSVQRKKNQKQDKENADNKKKRKAIADKQVPTKR